MAAACVAAPADEPVRVDLPVYDQPQAPSDVKLAEPLLPENRGGEPLIRQHGAPLVGNIISQKINTVSSALGSRLNNGHQVRTWSVVKHQTLLSLFM